MRYIDIDSSISQIQELLDTLGWIPNENITGVTIPGAGNMNVVLRISTDQRSFILKQSRPFVQKYPDLPAPKERIAVEYRFYQVTAPKIQNHTAHIIHYSPDDCLMMIADLGDCEDMVYLYADRTIDDKDVETLVQVAEHIHSTTAPADYPENLELRKLNHQHIFELPFLEDNGFQLDDIQDGLQELSMVYKRDGRIKSIVQALGNQYLRKGDCLIHGDYYPGSWMKAQNQIYVIDPEFSFVGFKEFDLGVMIGHLIMTTADLTYLDRVCTYYSSPLDKVLVSKIAGTEIMRRLIGLAQLPLERTLEEKAKLLELAKTLLVA